MLNLTWWRTDPTEYYWGHIEAVLRAKFRLTCYALAFFELWLVSFHELIFVPGLESLVWLFPMIVSVNAVAFLLGELRHANQWGEDWWPRR